MQLGMNMRRIGRTLSQVWRFVGHSAADASATTNRTARITVRSITDEIL